MNELNFNESEKQRISQNLSSNWVCFALKQDLFLETNAEHTVSFLVPRCGKNRHLFGLNSAFGWKSFAQHKAFSQIASFSNGQVRNKERGCRAKRIKSNSNLKELFRKANC